MTSRRPVVDGFYDEGTGSVAYIVADPETARCAIIDPVLGFDRDSGATDTRLADQMADHVRARGLTVEWVLDTHPHADHLSAVAYLGDRLGAPTGIGERVAAVQESGRTSTTCRSGKQRAAATGTVCSPRVTASGSAGWRSR
ncbi:MBL fold metallo-hydrolase [Paeniroseomonas aquatica]|uniref:MBL fold metallo-hydrolase n=1 Tax=Paeniroseomonas aquatica TaxID=373043 RepID=UPI0036104FCD